MTRLPCWLCGNSANVAYTTSLLQSMCNDSDGMLLREGNHETDEQDIEDILQEHGCLGVCACLCADCVAGVCICLCAMGIRIGVIDGVCACVMRVCVFVRLVVWLVCISVDGGICTQVMLVCVSVCYGCISACHQHVDNINTCTRVNE